MVARNASLVLTALLRQVLTLLFHRVANRVANFVASGVASRHYHLVAKPVLTMLPTVLPTKKTCLYGGVTGLSARRPNLCGCVWLAVVAGLLIRRSGCRAGQRGDAGASPDCFPGCVSSLAVSVSGCH